MGALCCARDWEEIRKSGKLVVLTAKHRDTCSLSGGLHRIVSPADRELALLGKFAAENSLKLELVHLAEFPQIFTELDRGKGDLAAYMIRDTPERRKKYLMTRPVNETREVVFTAVNSAIKGNTLDSLRGHKGWILPGTSFQGSMEKLKDRLTFSLLKKNIPNDMLMDLVAQGRIEYSVMDEGYIDSWMAYNSGIRKVCPLPEKGHHVFLAKTGSDKLISRLDAFLKKTAQDKDFANPVADWDTIKKRGFIRVLTQNDAFCCYIRNGALVGFEYELVKHFAARNGLQISLVIPPKFADLTKWLAEGRGDLIAANFTMSEERAKQHPDLVFCAPYGGAVEYMVGRENEKAASIRDLDGRKIAVRKGNSYFNTLKNLQAQGAKFEIVLLPENLTTPRIITLVGKGKIDLTVADDVFIHLMQNNGVKVKKLFPVSEKHSYSWVVRKNNPKLASAVAEYFRKENRSAFFNLTSKKYYSPSNAKKAAPVTLNYGPGTLSCYDPIFKKYGDQYGFLWYFLAAQSYQESRFDVNATNRFGAQGLMQIMPRTAKELGFSDVIQPDNGIHAGTKYLSSLRNRFESPEITSDNRLIFALASYNAGYGHIQDARKLALQRGLDPNVWRGNVEVALDLLSDPEFASKAKYGYCRSFETLRYVRNIMEHASGYERMLDAQREAPVKPGLPNSGVPGKGK